MDFDEFAAEQEELIEDMEKYDEKLKQFHEGYQKRDSDPETAKKLMGDAWRYFEWFEQKYEDEEDQFLSSEDRDIFDTSEFESELEGLRRRNVYRFL